MSARVDVASPSVPPRRMRTAVAACALLAVVAPLWAQEEEAEKPWSNQTELALVQTSGNAESLTFSLKNQFVRHWAGSRLTLSAHALRAESTDRVLTNAGGEVMVTEVDTVTAEQYDLTVKYDREIDERLGWFAFGGWRRNQITGIDDRYNLDGGVSYAVLDSERHTLIGEAGLGFTDEYPVVGASESFATARGLGRYERRLGATSSLETELEAIQNLDDSEDLRVNFLLGVTAKINSRLALKASYTASFDDDPASQILPGDDPGEPVAVFDLDSTDTILSVSLVIDF